MGIVPHANGTITKRATTVGSLGYDVTFSIWSVKGVLVHFEGSTLVGYVEGSTTIAESADARITSDGVTLTLDGMWDPGDVITTIKTPTANGTTKTVNGTFAAGTDWTLGTGWTIAGGVAVGATGDAANLAETATTVVSGETYLLTYTIKTVTTAGTLTPTAGGQTLTARVGTVTSTSATYTEEFTATSTAALTFGKSSTWAGTIDNVSLCKVTPINVSLIAWR